MNDNNNDFSLLLASSVHDMKNSLGMLLSSLEDLMNEYPAKEDNHKKKYCTLQGEASRIRNDLIYLLGIYRLQRDELPVQVEEIFVNDFLEEQVAQNSILFDIRDIKTTVQCEEDLVGYFDDDLIAGVLNNILVNAARYTKDSIVISADIDDEYLQIKVTDNGGGYPEMMIREPSAYVKGIDFDSGSTSLGLYFAAQIAAMHTKDEMKGMIAISNLPSGGGCFTLKLP